MKKQDEECVLGRLKGNLKMGLVGLPNVGKSTTFNFLAKQSVRAENFPFCTVDPHEARMCVPDERFDYLCNSFKPKSMVPAYLTLYDIAGLVPGAHKGEGLGNAFLSHIQAVDGIYHVIRAFEDQDIVHTEGEVNPIKDMITIHDELRFKDLHRCQSLYEETSKQYKRNLKDTRKRDEVAILESILEVLNNNKWISQHKWNLKEIEFLNELQLLTAKPVIYLVNLSINDFVKQKNKWLAKIFKWVDENQKGPIIPYSADLETQISNLSTVDEKKKLLDQHGIKKNSLEKIIVSGYETLKLMHFFTCGADEVKCWTIRKGTKAPQAAGIIHTDFEKGFVAADIYKYDHLVQHGSESNLKNEGLIRQQGKNYIMEDGDIVFFKCNTRGVGKK